MATRKQATRRKSKPKRTARKSASLPPILKNAGKRVPTEPQEETLADVLKDIPRPFDLADRKFTCPEEPDRQTIRTILNFVRLGAPPETAAGALGLPPVTFRAWLQKGVRDAVTGGNTPCARLLTGLIAAGNQAEIAEIIRLRQGDDTAKFVLERRYPKNWSAKTQAEVELTLTDVGSEKPALAPQQLTPEDAAALTILYDEFVATKEAEPSEEPEKRPTLLRSA